MPFLEELKMSLDAPAGLEGPAQMRPQAVECVCQGVCGWQREGRGGGSASATHPVVGGMEAEWGMAWLCHQGCKPANSLGATEASTKAEPKDCNTEVSAMGAGPRCFQEQGSPSGFHRSLSLCTFPSPPNTYFPFFKSMADTTCDH